MRANTQRHFLKLFSAADRAEFSRLDRRKNWLQTTVGKRIRYSRFKKEISQTDLAHLCGLSQSAITNVELDKKDSLFLLEISIILRISFSWLRCGKGSHLIESLCLSDTEIDILQKYRGRPAKQADAIRLMDHTRPIQAQKQSLGERLKARREELAISQSELSRNTGISQTMISALETATKHRIHDVLELAEKLGVSPDWLALGYGDRNAKNIRVTPSDVDFIYLFRRQTRAVQKKIIELLSRR